MLSNGARLLLLRHVLANNPIIHLLAIMLVPKKVFSYLNKTFSSSFFFFFWDVQLTI